MLSLFNSLTRSKEEFNPQTPNKVSMYVCGITPNNATHLGHAFTYISFDALVRYLKYKKFEVNYLQNATDINDSDDVIKQAKQEGRTWQEEAEHWVNHFHMQMDRLNVLRPTNYVLASSAIDKIIDINSSLLRDGFAYEKLGNVYFDISKFPKYGELSRFTQEQMLYISGERGNNPDDPCKKTPLDFVLWFNAPANPAWDSPWGKGRPGWHIECTSMILKYLGLQIDIHGGGRDLIYPHHESEIAQSEALTHGKVVNTWMHTAMVLYEGEKMSKTLGNLVLVEDLLKKYSPDAIRWLILSHHYRSPWEYEEYELEEFESKMKNIRPLMLDIQESSKQLDNETMRKFESIMDQDINTPRVLEFVEQLVQKNKKPEAKHILEILGFKLE